ncbi:hypothetical protein C2845_PM01G32360 [Panicum miliaceum]|uniref:Uncharacterized protein n=1 Tax=Panicum miliaceum TaxID=4540 RepID=A0A3L6TIA7_PANMI|nr:hypothetical protein C2845_PM01G32360 [Panicum miliaceum]
MAPRPPRVARAGDLRAAPRSARGIRRAATTARHGADPAPRPRRGPPRRPQSARGIRRALHGRRAGGARAHEDRRAALRGGLGGETGRDMVAAGDDIYDLGAEVGVAALAIDDPVGLAGPFAKGELGAEGVRDHGGSGSK